MMDRNVFLLLFRGIPPVLSVSLFDAKRSLASHRISALSQSLLMLFLPRHFRARTLCADEQCRPREEKESG